MLISRSKDFIMSSIISYDITAWNPSPTKEIQSEIIEQLEKGKVIYFPKLTFPINLDQGVFLDPNYLSKGQKNISYDPKTQSFKGLNPQKQNVAPLKEIIKDFSTRATQLITTLFPYYHSKFRIGRTSFRPAEIAGRKTSYRKDDTRLHVDAFPSTPMQGERILRLFCNINPYNQPRQWHLGESFGQVIKQFAPAVSPPLPLAHTLLNLLGITKRKRSLYDHYMLKIHNTMKGDEEYQKKAIQEKIASPANTTWVVFTDLVSHAALSGQHLLEQTFYIPPTAQFSPQYSPLKKLETLLGHNLLK
ncbi:Kdo hydroxylase family protein [Coxiella burnetii]|uniref:Kdo hydroxylase family protein n=1 Tax=Coxiella burnetii TaxID=777 RepID=UPI00077446D0|nr:Kdo hydroxylase family protein [Coxiella burnetii]AML55190.1 hypothetical protein AYM38_07920 [Coxiella burnetii]